MNSCRFRGWRHYGDWSRCAFSGRRAERRLKLYFGDVHRPGRGRHSQYSNLVNERRQPPGGTDRPRYTRRARRDSPLADRSARPPLTMLASAAASPGNPQGYLGFVRISCIHAGVGTIGANAPQGGWMYRIVFLLWLGPEAVTPIEVFRTVVVINRPEERHSPACRRRCGCSVR